MSEWGFRVSADRERDMENACTPTGYQCDRPPVRIKLSDGSSWPRPAMESDEYQGVGWKCRYSPESLTREDLLQLASIADAYGYLLLEATQERRDFVCREARRWITEEVCSTLDINEEGTIR